MLNWLKSSVIKTADWINELHDPFDPFTRPILTRSKQTLEVKEKLFFDQLLSEFRFSNGIYNYFKTYPGEQPVIGDQALWHGINTGTLAMKYHVTHIAQDLRNVQEALDAMRLHRRLARGGERLVRGINPLHRDLYADDASNDALTGHLYGLYMAWKYCPPLQMMVTNLVVPLTNCILLHDYAMVNEDDRPTTYGQLVQGWKTDPLRLTLCLALLFLAYSATQDKRYEVNIYRLCDAYRPILMYPKVRLLWWDKSYDTHRAGIHLLILADLAPPGELQALFKDGLRRLWGMEQSKADPWLLSLVAEQISLREAEWKRVVMRLSEYEFEERGPMLERLNTLKKDYWNVNGVRMLLWNKKLRASQPLPFWMMASQDFFPQRDLRSPDGWQGSTDQRLRHSGADFLASYWRLAAQGKVRYDQ